MRNDYQLGTRIVRQTAMPFIEFPHIIRSELKPEDGKPTLVVLGKPWFYARCGFSSAKAARLKASYPVQNLLIARAGDDIPEETLIYPAAFDGL